MAITNDKEILVCLAFAFFAEERKDISENNWLDNFNGFTVARDLTLTKLHNKQPFELKEGTPLTYETVIQINECEITYSKDDFIEIPYSEMADKSVKKYKDFFKTTSKFDEVFKLNRTKFDIKQTGISLQKSDKCKLAYRMSKQAISSHLFPDDLSGYIFFDQSDPFTIAVKDGCMEQMKRVFHTFPGKTDLLSPVDMFFVKKKDYDVILNDFKTNIIDNTPNDILANITSDDKKDQEKTYHAITRKYFLNKSLIPISLKFPDTVNAVVRLSIVGERDTSSYDRDSVDPYGLFLGRLLQDGVDVKKMISDLIEIKFDKFDISDQDTLGWSFPIDFNYNKTGISDTTLEFVLKNPRGGIFNGMWKIKTTVGTKTMSPWVSGIGGSAADHLLKNYPVFNTKILEKIIETRVRVFKNMINMDLLKKQDEMRKKKEQEDAKNGKKIYASKPSQKSEFISKELIHQYDIVIKELSQKFVVTPTNLPMTKHFFDLCDTLLNVKNTKEKYYAAVAKELVSGFVSGKLNRYPQADFIHSQYSFFLFNWAENSEAKLILQKSIFLSIFGLLTKSGYNIFDNTESGKVKIRELLVAKLKEKEGHYTVAPFILMG